MRPMAKDASQELTLRAMVAMASADGTLDAREIATIRQIFEQRRGTPVEAEEVERAANAFRDAGRPIVDDLTTIRPSLDMEEREEIIRAGYLVLLADERISGEERKRLKDIATALDISEIQFGAILEELAVTIAAKAR